MDLFDEKELLDYGYGPEAMHGEPTQQADCETAADVEIDNFFSTPGPELAPSSAAVEDDQMSVDTPTTSQVQTTPPS